MPGGFMHRLAFHAYGPGLGLFVLALAAIWLTGPVTAWGAEPSFLTIEVCADHPHQPDLQICERRYAQPFPDRALCERAVDIDGDGVDQVWLDLAARMTVPGQWIEIQCPPYTVPGG